MQAPKLESHELELTVIIVGLLVCVALNVLSEIIDRAKIVYIKIRNFNKPNDISKADNPLSKL
jgi:hypothetical protein